MLPKGFFENTSHFENDFVRCLELRRYIHLWWFCHLLAMNSGHSHSHSLGGSGSCYLDLRLRWPGKYVLWLLPHIRPWYGEHKCRLFLRRWLSAATQLFPDKLVHFQGKYPNFTKFVLCMVLWIEPPLKRAGSIKKTQTGFSDTPGLTLTPWLLRVCVKTVVKLCATYVLALNLL